MITNMNILFKFNRWFNLNLGWLFVNGRKREYWDEYILNKYKKKK